MSTKDKLTVIDSAGFQISRCMDELETMMQLSAEPISPEQVKRFNEAKDRFWVSANRAKREHGLLS